MSLNERKGPAGQKVIATAPSGGWSSGDLITLASGTTGWVGEALDDVAATETGAVEVGHQAKIAKNTSSGESFSQGDLVYKDASTGDASSISSGNDLIGRCTEDAAVADTHVWVAFAPTGG